jgi:hypothetical protein
MLVTNLACGRGNQAYQGLEDAHTHELVQPPPRAVLNRELQQRERRAVAVHVSLKAIFETRLSLYRLKGLKPGAFKLWVQ